MNFRAFASLIISLSFATNARSFGASYWPEFRGPTGQGISLATNVPVKWSATNRIAWKVSVPGEGWSSPVIVSNRIYLTSAVSDTNGGWSLRALCFALEDGALRWDKEVFEPNPAEIQTRHKKNGAASPTPIVAGDRIYVHFGHMGTAALDLDGKILWRQNEIKYSPVHGNGGSPALIQDKLIFSCDGASDPFVIGLSAKTGKVLWRTPRKTHASKTFSFATPLAIEVDGQFQVILPGSGIVAAYAPADGGEIWRVKYGEGYSVITRPVYAHGLIFVSSSYDRPILYAIDPKGARGDSTAEHVKWSHAKGVPNTPSLVVVGDELYFVSDAGIATCADVRKGTVHWTERLGGGFSASPVVAEGKIYFQNEEGVGFVVKASKTFELLSTNPLGERTLASPAVLDGAIVLRSQGNLWKIKN